MVGCNALQTLCIAVFAVCVQTSMFALPAEPAASTKVPSSSASARTDDGAPAWLGLGFTWHRGTAGQQNFPRVQKVTPAGPADRAGIKAGDIITTINEQPIGFSDQLEFILYLSTFRPGDKLRVKLVRQGAEMLVSVVLGTMPPELREQWKEGLEHARRTRLRQQEPASP